MLLVLSLNNYAQNSRSNAKKSVAYNANYKRVAIGDQARVVEIREGTLWGWGGNSNGTGPVQIGTDDKWVSVSSGNINHIGLKSDGTIWTWNPASGVPGQTGVANNWASICAKYDYVLALKTDGTLWGWGNNSLANGLGFSTTTPSQVGTSKWIKVGAIGNHGLGIKADGTLWSWGKNNYSQLGDGGTTDRSTPLQVGTDNNWTDIGGGANHSLALKTDGSLWAWGSNVQGQLGIGSSGSNQTTPIRVGTDNDWTSISNGTGANSFALKSNGSLWAWGLGYLGNGVITTSPFQTVPLQIGTDTWASIESSAGTIFALKPDGTLWGWGLNTSSQLGNGTIVDQLSPVQVSTKLSAWLSVSAGATYSTAVKTNGSLWGWGENAFGQLGDGSTTTRTVQTQIGADTKWTSVVAGQDHTIGLKADGTLWAWGHNNFSQLGDGSATNRTSPVQIGSTNNWVSIAAGAEHSIALRSDGTIWAWGHNNFSQLGDGGTTDHSSPAQVGTDNNWVSVAAGNFYCLALKANGTLWAWGQNANGQLGDGTNITKSSPVQIGTATWNIIVANSYHSMGIKTDGTLWSWGDNGYGQLGDASTIDRNNPVQIGTDTWVSASAGFFNSHAIRYDGRLYGWGKNLLGEIGDNSNTNRSSPVLLGTAYWIKMTAGNGHSLGLKASRREICGTGYNAFGQLGYFGTTNNLNSFLCAAFPVSCSVTAAATATTNVDCLENPTGTATILLSGTGSGAPGSYSVDGGASQPYTSNPFTITGLSKGNHTIVTTVAAVPCTSNSLAFTIGSSKITGTATTTGVSCLGNNDGTATVTLVGTSSLSPGTYTVGLGSPIPFTTNPFTVKGLAGFTQVINATVTSTGCSATVIAAVTAPAQYTGTVTTTGITCLGASNGTATITLSGTGASAPGTYRVDNGTPQPYTTNPFTVTGLTSVSHTVVTTTTAGSCASAGITFNIAASPTQVALAIVPTAVSCYGVNNDGSIAVTLSGSGASSSGTWKVTVNANIISSGSFSTNPFTVTGLGGSTYNLTVTTTLNSCISATTAFTVPSPPRLVCTYTTTPASCAGVSDATVTVTAPAGYVLPIHYSLTGGNSPNVTGDATTNPFTITGLEGHAYSVVTYSATGCETFGTAFIGTNAVTGTGSTTPVTCAGGSNGTATITLAGAGTIIPGTYTVDAGAPQPYTTNPFTITGLTSGNHTIKATVSSVACSTPNIAVFVGTNPAITLTYTSTITSCFNGNDGTATITVSGGAASVPGTYTLDGSAAIPYTTNPFTITGLTSAYHYVAVTVSSGPCTSGTLQVEVGYPSPFGSTVTTTTSHCSQTFGDGTATVTLTNFPSNTSGTYRLPADNQLYPFTGNPFTVTNLRGGSYDLDVFPNGGCYVRVPLNIAYETMLVTPLVTPVTCTGANDGTVTVTISGISAPTPGYYQLVYNGPQIPYTTNPFTINGLSPGLHQIGIYATTYNCNEYGVDVTIGTPSLSAGLSVTPVSCSGNADGTATITLTGLEAGNAGTYTVDGGAALPFTTNPFTVNGLAAGIRTIHLDVAGGACASNIMADIGTAVLSGLGITTPVPCSGTSTGSASILLSGAGTLFPGTYTVDGGSPQSYSGNPFTINNLSAGNHIVVAHTTGTSCTSTDIPINVGTASAITGTATTTAASCIGNNGTATITLSGQGSLIPGTYTIDGGSLQSYTTNPFTITGLTAGSHTVIATVTATSCNSTPISITVTGSGLSGSGTTTAADCFLNNNGTATITLSGAVLSAPGTYTVDGGSPQSYSTNPFTVTGLSGGTHTVVATVSAGACVADPVIVNVPFAAFTGSGTTTPVSCAGNTDGTATITLAGGSAGAPGTYTIDGGSSQSYTNNPFTITGLGAGDHTIIASVTGGLCTSAPILVNVTSATFTATYTKNNISACNGINDGSIAVTATGTGGPFTYSWAGSGGFTAGNVSTVSSLPIGYYNVTITNASGCGVVVINNIHIEFAYLVYITNSGTIAGSCGNNTGSITLFGNAGVLPYTYSLDGFNYQVSNTFLNLAAGSYTAFVKDAGGCVSQKPVTVGAAAPIIVSPFSRGSGSCANDGSIEIYRSGGVAPYTYSLDNITYVTGNIFNGLAGGIYTAYVKDSRGCVASQPIAVSQSAALTVTVSKQNSSTCVNNGSAQASIVGGVPPYTYSMNGITFQPGNTFAGLVVGNYTLTVKDFKGCTGTKAFIIDPNPITVNATPRSATNCVNNGKIEIYRSGGFAPYSYSLDNITYQPGSVFTNLPAGVYIAYVKDGAGCVGTRTGIVVNQLAVGCRPVAISDVNNAPLNPLFKVNVYPNPSETEFTVILTGYSNEKPSFTVTDVAGRKIIQSTGNVKQTYKFGKNLRPGVYILEVKQGENRQSIRIVKE